MGFLDDLFSDPFDLDGNGKRSLDEDFMEFMMFNEVMKESNDYEPDSDELEDDDEIY